jgi:PAS domain S-box-containing protein
MTDDTAAPDARVTTSSVPLPAREDFLRRVLSSIDDHFVMLDREWRYVYLNERMLQDSGQTAEEMTGRVVWDVHPGRVGRDYETTARRAVAEQRPERVTFHYAPSDKWFEV